MGKLFDVSLVFSSIPELLTKLPITLELAVVSMLIGLGLGLVMAIIKMKKIRVLTQITNLLISLLRGTPVIVQLAVRCVLWYSHDVQGNQPAVRNESGGCQYFRFRLCDDRSGTEPVGLYG